MKILVYGIGGVGGYFGGRLIAAGHEVSMIARGDHLEAINKNGLVVESINGDIKVAPKVVTDDVSKVETPDLVILGVKSWQIPEVAKILKPYISENTMILPLQNGADNIDALLEVFDKKNLIGGLCHIVSFVEKPGKIKHTSFEPRITFGELDNRRSDRLLKLQELFNTANIANYIPEDIQLEIWKKFLFISMISGIGGLTRVSIDKMWQSHYIRDLIIKSGKETLALAKAKNINLQESHLESAISIIQKQPQGTTASTQRDIIAGRPSELEKFNGYIVKEGLRLGVETPINRFIYECLLPLEHKARKS